MPAWGAESYWLVRFLLQRGLAVIYLLASPDDRRTR